jgi:hypothetical protein
MAVAFTQTDLDAIDAAIASGELTVSHNGRTVTYRSMDDLLKARKRIEDVLNRAAGNCRGSYRYSFQTGRGE